MEIFLNVAEGCLCDLSEEVNSYYNIYKELQKPSSEADPEEIKKIKEMINSYKKTDG